MLRKVFSVAGKKLLQVVFHKINFAFDFQSTSGIDTSESEIAMETSANPLEQLLVGFPSSCENMLIIVGVAADEAIIRDVLV